MRGKYLPRLISLSSGRAKEWPSTCAGPSLKHCFLWNPWTRVKQITSWCHGRMQKNSQSLVFVIPREGRVLQEPNNHLKNIRRADFGKIFCVLPLKLCWIKHSNGIHLLHNGNCQISSRYDAFSLFIGLPAEFPALKAIFLYYLSDISPPPSLFTRNLSFAFTHKA